MKDNKVHGGNAWHDFTFLFRTDEPTPEPKLIKRECPCKREFFIRDNDIRKHCDICVDYKRIKRVHGNG